MSATYNNSELHEMAHEGNEMAAQILSDRGFSAAEISGSEIY